MTRRIPDCLPPFLKKAERPVMRVYDDAQPKLILKPGSKVLGTLTAGIGHTGADVVIGLKVTQAMVDRWLDIDMVTAALRLANVVTGDVIDSLTDNQYAALLSFVFNLGANPGWTIWKLLNAREYDQVPAQIARFVNAGGKKLEGLVNRRNAEIALWSTAEPGSTTVTPPSSVTRTAETPPAPSPPKEMDKQSVATKIGVLVAGGATAAGQAINVIQPHADLAPFLRPVLAGLAGVVVIGGLYGLWVHHEQAKRATS